MSPSRSGGVGWPNVPSVAIIFPGQGSHEHGMDEGLRDDPLFVHGLEVLGFDPFTRLDEGTRFQQPALFLCSVVAWEPRAAIAAPVRRPPATRSASTRRSSPSGALDFDAALRLVAAARRRDGPRRRGARRADDRVLGDDDGAVAPPPHEHGAHVANDNAPGQLVVAGSRGAGRVEAVDAIRARAPAARRLRRVPLAADGARRRGAGARARAPSRSARPASPSSPTARRRRSATSAPSSWRTCCAPCAGARRVIALRDLGAESSSSSGRAACSAAW